MITIKQWRDISGFNPINAETGEIDVDGTIERIALITGKDKTEIEEMDVSDLLPTFLKCVQDVNKQVFAKIANLPKNGEGDGR